MLEETKMRIEINYVVTINCDDIQKRVLDDATDRGFDFGNAGEVETLRRYLLANGTSNVFAGMSFDRDEVEIKRQHNDI